MVSYINASSNTLAQKGGFNTMETAKDWIKSQATNIKPLKLLVWDNEIDCYSTVEAFNNNLEFFAQLQKQKYYYL